MRQRRRGVWEVRIYLGRDPNSGTRRYRSKTVRGSKRDADRVCRDLVEHADAALPAHGDEEMPTLASWLDEWWASKQPSLSPNTVSAWRSSVELHLKPNLGEHPLHELRGHHLESLYRHLVESGLSPARVQKVHTVASVALKAAVRRELIAVSPAFSASPPAVARKEPTAPSVSEVERLLDACVGDLELHAFLVVSANTGARRGEICALRWSDVDLDGRVVTVRRSVAKETGSGAVLRQTKTGAAGRVAIGEQATAVLRQLLHYRRETALAAGEELPVDAFVWSQDVLGSRPTYPDTMTARFSQLRASVGLENVQLRQLRHFAATQLLSAGVDVRTVAGRLRHARPATTLDRYAAWVPARDQEAADVLDNIGGRGSSAAESI